MIHGCLSADGSAISGKQGRRESIRDGELVKAAQQATSSKCHCLHDWMSLVSLLYNTCMLCYAVL
jgi:hypothetical protein